MAISDTCKFEFKSNVDRVQREKKCSRRRAIAELAVELELLEETARKMDQRARKELGQIVPTGQPTETTTETTKSNEIKREPAKDGTMRGGRREGAGRKPSVSPAFQRATQAICALESIHPQDPERVAALNEVATWIERNK